LALNRFVVGTPAELDRHLRDHRPGEAVEVTVVRSGRIEFVETVLGERPFDVVTIEPASDPDGELSRLAALWLDSQAEHHGADA
jgi:predicted metalloprotease with PDZ domain